MLSQLINWWKSRKTNGIQVFKTSHGDFKRWHSTGSWYGLLVNGDSQINLYAIDVEGKPYPKFINHLSDILQQLPALESAARKAATQIDERFQLDSIHGEQLETDFALSFYYEESEDDDSPAKSITVYFQNGRVVNQVIDRYEPELSDRGEEEQNSNPRNLTSPFGDSSPKPWASSSDDKDMNSGPWS
jgi:hypothetical protein